MKPLVFALLFAPALAFAQHPIEAPMRLASQAPMQSLRLAVVPAVPSSLARGETEVALSGSWTNVWIYEPGLLLDYEALDSRLTVAYGLSGSAVLEIGVDERGAFGGFLDPLIQNFHRQIGNGQNGRDSVPRGTINIEVRDATTGEVLVERRHSGPFSRGVSAAISRTFDTSRGRIALGATARVPLRHSDDELSTSTDGGLTAAWARDFRGRSVHLGAGVTRFGNTALGAVETTRYQHTGFAALIQPLTSRSSVIVQYLFSEGVAAKGPLGRNAHEVTIGGRVNVGRGTAIELGLIENVFNYENGPDFGIHLAVVRRTGAPGAARSSM